MTKRYRDIKQYTELPCAFCEQDRELSEVRHAKNNRQFKKCECGANVWLPPYGQKEFTWSKMVDQNEPNNNQQQFTNYTNLSYDGKSIPADKPANPIHRTFQVNPQTQLQNSITQLLKQSNSFEKKLDSLDTRLSQIQNMLDELSCKGLELDSMVTPYQNIDFLDNSFQPISKDIE